DSTTGTSGTAASASPTSAGTCSGRRCGRSERSDSRHVDAIRGRDRKDGQQLFGLRAGPTRLRCGGSDRERGGRRNPGGNSLPHRRTQGGWPAHSSADKHRGICGRELTAERRQRTDKTWDGESVLRRLSSDLYLPCLSTIWS